MAPKSRTIIVLSTDAQFEQRVDGIYKSDKDTEIIHAASVEEAAELASEADGARQSLVVLSRSDDLAGQIPLLWRLRSTAGTQPPLIVVCPSMTDIDLMQLLTAGVEGYLPDDSNDDTIRLAVQCVMQGLSILPRHIQARATRLLFEAREMVREAPGMQTLSSREKEILGRIVAGDSNRDIAAALGISEGTVKTHVKSIFRKTKSVNRTQAALSALRHRIVER